MKRNAEMPLGIPLTACSGRPRRGWRYALNQPSIHVPAWRSLLAAGAAVLLSGCGCTLFSGDTGCQASNTALAVAVAPLAGLSALGEHARDVHRAQDMRQAVLAGDMHAQALCLVRCGSMAAQLGHDDYVRMLDVSATHLIGKWQVDPPSAALPILMAAHWQKTQWLKTDDAQQTLAQWREVAALAADPRMRTAVDAPEWSADSVNTTFYDNLAVDAQAALIRAQAAASGTPVAKDCQPAGPWPPAWMDAPAARRALGLACAVARLD